MHASVTDQTEEGYGELTSFREETAQGITNGILRYFGYTAIDYSPPPIDTLTASDHPEDGGGAIDLDWHDYYAPPDFDRYEIYRATSPIADVGPLTPLDTITLPDTQNYTDITTSDGTPYYYAIVAVDISSNVNTTVICFGPVESQGESWSPILTPPSNLVIGHNDENMSIQWDSMGTNVNMFNIYESTDPHAPWPWALVGDGVAETYFNHTGAWGDGLEHFYIVRGRNPGYIGPNSTMGAKSVLVLGAGLNLVGMDLPIDLIRPDGGFGPEGCKNTTLEIEAQNPGVSVLVIRKYTAGGWVKYEPSQEPFTSYFNMYAKEGYFIQLDNDPVNEWRVASVVFESPQTITLGSGLNLVSPPTDLVRPDGGFGPEGCKNATVEIEAQNGGVSVLMIRKYTTGGWVKYEPSQEPFTSYFNMDADKGYFIQVSADPPNEWITSW